MNIAVILAAGKGERMLEHNIPKGFINVLGKPLLYYALKTFQECEEVDRIILVIPEDFFAVATCYQKEFGFSKFKQIVVGGKTRQESVLLALQNSNASEEDVVLIHDAARPLVSQRIIKENISTALKVGGAATMIPTSDTIIISKDGKSIDFIPDRNEYYLEQTPASFCFAQIYQAHLLALKKGINDVSDDLKLYRDYGGKIGIVKGEKDNFKVTSEEDLAYLLMIIDK